jgi:nitrite reductase (NO-forming)
MPALDPTTEVQQHSAPQDVPPVRGLLARVRANSRAKDWFRITFGLIWVIDAVLKWEPAFRNGYTAMLRSAAQGQPGWLHGWFHFWITLVAPNEGFFAYSTAVIETLIAVAVIFGFARKLTYISAALFSVLIWATGEGFGGPYTSSSTDIGTAVIYAVVFVGLLALNYEAGPSRFSVDYLIEQRVSWWHRIAEVGHRRQRDTPAASTAVPPVAPAAPVMAGPPVVTTPAAVAPPIVAVPMSASPAADAGLVTSAGSGS